jgi:hypothetical protein
MTAARPFFETVRLVVRPLAETDLDALVAYRSHPDRRALPELGHLLPRGRPCAHRLDARWQPAYRQVVTSSRWRSVQAARS